MRRIVSVKVFHKSEESQVRTVPMPIRHSESSNGTDDTTFTRKY